MNGYTGNYGTILDARLKHLYPETAGRITDEFSKYTNKVTHKELFYLTTSVAGLAMGQIIGEGQVPASDAPIQGFTKVFTQGIFSHRVRLTKRAYYYLFEAKDGAKIQSNLKDEIMNLKDAIVHLKNYYSQSLLAQGFATSFTFTPINGFSGSVNVDTTGADGVAYWSASHPRIDGGAAQSNLVFSGTVNPLFSFTALLAARAQQTNKKDGRGLPLVGAVLNTLICQQDSQTYFLATSIKKTLDAGKVPSVALTGGNFALVSPINFMDSAPTSSFEVVGLSPYGTSGLTSIMWFMYDSKKVNKDFGFQFIESMPEELIQVQDNVGAQDFIWTITTYCQFGANDLLFFMASNGTTV
jgi:hypothetical protein